MESLTRKRAKVGMPAFFATNPCYTFSPVCTADKLFQPIDSYLRRIGIGLVPSKRFSDY